MKRLLTLAIATLASVVCFSAIAAASVGVVNMQKVFQSSPQVKQINTMLQKKFASRRTSIVTMGKTLQADMQKFQKNRSVMKAKDAAALKAKITAEGQKLRQAQMSYQQALFSAQNKQMTQFMTKVKGVIKTLAGKKNITLVLPSNTVLFATGDTDLTTQVISNLK